MLARGVQGAVFLLAGAFTGLLVLLAAVLGIFYAFDDDIRPGDTPDLPDGVEVVSTEEPCGSGGCWSLVTVRPASGQTPAELAAELELSQDERCGRSWFLDPRETCRETSERDGALVIFSYSISSFFRSA